MKRITDPVIVCVCIGIGSLSIRHKIPFQLQFFFYKSAEYKFQYRRYLYARIRRRMKNKKTFTIRSVENPTIITDTVVARSIEFSRFSFQLLQLRPFICSIFTRVVSGIFFFCFFYHLSNSILLVISCSSRSRNIPRFQTNQQRFQREKAEFFFLYK